MESRRDLALRNLSKKTFSYHRINRLLEGYLRHFSANQPEGLELLDVAQCCYKLTTKKLCVELQPLRVGHGATASDAPHHCGWRRLAHQPSFLPRRGRSATT
ncbi:hypothetical protein CR513_01581, partial [Mucuna pruriens]